jgi:predicted nucleic acid-binding protein
MNVTFSAEETQIQRARRIAAERGTTLNEEFRRWLNQYGTSEERGQRLKELFDDLGNWRPGRTWSRQERNAFDSRVPEKQHRSQELMSTAGVERAGTISYQVIQEFTNVCLKSERPMTSGNVRRIVSELCEPLEIVHFSMGLYERALQMFERYRTGWYDALIVAAAQEAKCTVLYSEDLHHGLEVGGLVVTNPFRK